MSKKILKLGTRKSLLAMTQSAWIKNQLQALNSDITIKLVQIITKGDKILDVPLAKVGGKGLFVKEIEEALLSDNVDFAVHSLKDVPAEIPEGLEASIFSKREDARDAFISNTAPDLQSLSSNAIVGTSSLRRIAQIKAIRPDLNIKSLRGNIDTRLKKLDNNEFDAIILASAGLHRLNLKHRITGYLNPEIMIPAIGQGALAIEFRKNDQSVKEILLKIHDKDTEICVRAERALLKRLEGGCQVPIGGYAQIFGDELEITAIVGDEKGEKIIKRRMTGSISDPESLGISIAEEILKSGGEEILKNVYNNAK
jgi:hydroxymethylbilane synthase